MTNRNIHHYLSMQQSLTKNENKIFDSKFKVFLYMLVTSFIYPDIQKQQTKNGHLSLFSFHLIAVYLSQKLDKAFKRRFLTARRNASAI